MSGAGARLRARCTSCASSRNPSGGEFFKFSRAFRYVSVAERLQSEADPLPLQAFRCACFPLPAGCSPIPSNRILCAVCVARSLYVCNTPARHLRPAREEADLAPARGASAMRHGAASPSPLSVLEHAVWPPISTLRGNARDAACRLPFWLQTSDALNHRSLRGHLVSPILLARHSVVRVVLLAGRAMAGGAPTSGHVLPAPVVVGLPHVESGCVSGWRPSGSQLGCPGLPPPPPPPLFRRRPETVHISRLAQRIGPPHVAASA